MLFEILKLQLFGFVSLTICCDCWLENWKWVPCESLESHPLEMDIYHAAISHNCGKMIIKGTSNNNFSHVTSYKMEAEGEVNGIKVTFSEQNGCTKKDSAPDDDDGIRLINDAMPFFCGQLQSKMIDLDLLMSNEVSEVLESVAGDFIMTTHFNVINGDPDLSDCYTYSASLKCNSGEWE